MKRFILIFAGILAFLGKPGHATLLPLPAAAIPVISLSSTTVVAGTATVTISSPVATTYSTGLYTYITHVRIEMYATGTLTGGATPVTCSWTNLANKVYELPTAAATGTTTVIEQSYESNPIQAPNAAINTVLTCPGHPSIIYNMTVEYYQGQ